MHFFSNKKIEEKPLSRFSRPVRCEQILCKHWQQNAHMQTNRQFHQHLGATFKCVDPKSAKKN